MKRGSLQIKYPVSYYVQNMDRFIDHVNDGSIIICGYKKAVISKIIQTRFNRNTYYVNFKVPEGECEVSTFKTKPELKEALEEGHITISYNK